MLDADVTLPDGRRLGYAEHGVMDGTPVVLFHGIPGGRALSLDDAALQDTGTRLITVERPGFGQSDPHPGRTLLDWPNDVSAFADALDLDHFPVLATSAGAPSALACGFALADRITKVGLAGGIGPVFDHPEFDEYLTAELQALLPVAREDQAAALELVGAFMAPVAEQWATDPDGAYAAFVEELPPADRALLTPDARAMWMSILESTYRRGADTLVEEIGASFGPWGFQPAEVTVPVLLWHGDADEGAPVPVARFLADALPQAALTEYANESHFLAEAHHALWLRALTT